MKFVHPVSLLLSFAAFAWGATPVARVISKSPIDVTGVTVPERDYVPVYTGDVISTHKSEAVLQFRDGRSVTLQPDSELKLEASGGSPSFRILRGSASYSLPPSAHRPGFTQIPIAAAPRVAATGAGVMTGTLNANCSCPTGTAPSNPQIVTPSGLTINLAAVTSASGGTTYHVVSVQQTVATSNGPAVVTVTTGPLIGALVTGVGNQPTSGSTVTFGFVAVGQSAPLTPTQLSTTLQSSLQTAVTTAVQNGQLPTGTQLPSPGITSTGQFSSSAP